jgi:hypothetical protein
MEWDKLKMAQRFLQKANAIHPEDAYDEPGRVNALARQDVYYDCYMSSFSREDLMKRLANVIDGNIKMPEEDDVDEAQYRATYISEARIVLGLLGKGEMK